jgi:hypothetical protein
VLEPGTYRQLNVGLPSKGRGASMSEDTYKNYLRDLVYLLRERGGEALRRSREPGEMAEFEQGRSMAYIEVLSLMQHQADAFQLPRDELLLSGFDPENDAIDPPPLAPRR